MDRHGFAGLLGAAALMVATTATVSAGKAEEARALLKRLNTRWVGAEARMRVSIPIKDKIDGEGWSKSPILMHDAVNDGDQRFFFRVQVSNRRSLGNFIAGDQLLAGTAFRAVGWGFENPDRAKGLFLKLNFVDVPASMRWTFSKRGFSTKPAFNAEELGHIERYLRLDAFELRAAEEKLALVAPAATPTPLPLPPTPMPTLRRPAITQLVVDVQPREAVPGEEIRLVVSYELSGLRRDESREVTEIRRITSRGTLVSTFENRVARSSGRVMSALPVRIPPDAAPGLYTAGTTLQTRELSPVSATVSFIVRLPGGE